MENLLVGGFWTLVMYIGGLILALGVLGLLAAFLSRITRR